MRKDLEVESDALDRLSSGRKDWQQHWRDGVKHTQITCTVPIGPIENHDDMLVLPDREAKRSRNFYIVTVLACGITAKPLSVPGAIAAKM